MKIALGAAVAALLLAPAAAGKGEAQPVPVCGFDRCVQSHHGFDLVGIQPASPLRYVTAPPFGPYYIVRFSMGWAPEQRVFYVPGVRLVRSGFNWTRIDLRLASRLGDETAGVRPYPPPVLTGVLVGSRQAGELAAYVHVFDRLPEAPVAPPDARGYALVLRSDAPSPWTNENTNVTYFPAVGTLHRHGEWIRAPASLARKIDHDLGVVPPGAGSDGAPFPWGPIGAAVGAGLIATLVAALSFRRRKPARAS